MLAYPQIAFKKKEKDLQLRELLITYFMLNKKAKKYHWSMVLQIFWKAQCIYY